MNGSRPPCSKWTGILRLEHRAKWFLSDRDEKKKSASFSLKTHEVGEVMEKMKNKAWILGQSIDPQGNFKTQSRTSYFPKGSLSL